MWGLSNHGLRRREGNGEIEAADAGRLPTPLQAADILGLLHCHTRFSDGLNTMVSDEQIQQKASGDPVEKRACLHVLFPCC